MESVPTVRKKNPPKDKAKPKPKSLAGSRVEAEELYSGIVVRGAREHNLKSIDVQVPRNQVTVITGLSGSGKSSLAFDTIYAEGQRRYVESLSAYARNFMEQLKKPEVDSMTGLSPAIAIDQKSISTNPRSTAGTVTEIYDYLRLLYARVAQPLCPEHQVPLSGRSPQEIVADLMRRKKGTRLFILAPVAQGEKGEFNREFQKWLGQGFQRARIDGEWVELTPEMRLAKRKSHDIEILIDRVVIKEGLEARLSESVNLALSLGGGQVAAQEPGREMEFYSLKSACPVCGFSLPPLEPRMFSFNNPKGACPTCKGLGSLELAEMEEPTAEFSQAPASFEGEDELEVDEYALSICPSCHGSRLNPAAMSVLFAGKNIFELSSLPAEELVVFLRQQQLNPKEKMVGEKILGQIIDRLDYMVRVGCGYLSLARPTRTLSGGEAQRLRLAAQLGSSLVGVLYVLDEPSIGLHPRDHHSLLKVIRQICDRGNTILMVEHDEDTMRMADQLIDLGPRAGRLGGELMAIGSPQEVAAQPQSLTGQYLSGRKKISFPSSRRSGSGLFLELKGASGNNLKEVDLRIPLGTLCGVSGVSGGGKSTLIVDTLYRLLAREFNGSSQRPAPYRSLHGLENLDRVIEINQRPIGRTPRSVPATYVGLFPQIRQLFAQLPESKVRGFKPGHFSFNVKGGRCESCQGAGMVRMAMHFLSDVFVRCESCQGSRYSREVLNIKYRDKSIADVLSMSIGEAEEFFRHHSLIHRKLQTLARVGLDYISLGQSSTTLSGGEAQRIKLSRELSKRPSGKTLYILDEPTTGLHFEDIQRLLELLHELVDQGNTVLVIEHQLDVLKSCDHLIDMGPEGGRGGGQIVAQGTPEQVAAQLKSPTAAFLRAALEL